MALEERARLLTEQLMALDQVKEWKRAIQKELAQPQYSVGQVHSLRASTPLENPILHSLLEKMGLLGRLKRTVIDLHCEAVQTAAAASRKQLKHSTDDGRLLPGERTMNGCSLDVVRAARDNWEKITSDEMLRVVSELRRPMVAPKATVETAHDDGQVHESLPSSDAEGAKPARQNRISSARFLYDGCGGLCWLELLNDDSFYLLDTRNDLLRALQAIEPANRVPEQTDTSTDAWGSIKLQLYSPPFPEFRRLYSELAPECGQIGLDELFPAQRDAFIGEKNRVGDLVLAHQSVSMARQYSKTGCPVSLRPRIWRQILSVPVTAQDRSYFEHLTSQATRWAYLTDDMYLLDLQQTIDSSDYFVFQDHLESVLMAFTRDTYAKGHALQVNGAVTCAGIPPTDNFQPHEPADTTENRVPPNGVLPFSGLVMYMAPLAYLYADPVELYYVFRELYVKYWSKLNAIRSERGTILPLCKLFEDLVVRSSPAAVFHLINIGLKPLDVAFPWIQCAFSGVLDIDQVLLLWDRIIGYDSLELVAIFAAALFHFRAGELELVNTREEADDLFAELIDIPVVTLLQDYLFGLQ